MKKKINKLTISREELPIKILQFGDGNFLRGFVDWMIEKANVAGVLHHGVSVMQPRSRRLSEIMIEQDCMYHVYLEGTKEQEIVRDITLVTCIQNVANPYLEYSKYEEVFLNPHLEFIISNTTEAGIRYDANDDIFALPPESFPAKMTALLYKRFQKFEGAKDKGLLILCTELIENNGTTLKEYIVQHSIQHKLFDFVDWLNETCYFYDTLVDRIVSGFPKSDADELQMEIGYADNLIVKGEYYHLWAICGNPIIKEKFPLHRAGLNVLFVDDISVIAQRKVRILNGAHTAMVAIALQLGYNTVAEAFGDSLIENFIRSMIVEEVLPMLDGDRSEINDFAEDILERFHNPFIQHYLIDIALNSLSKWESRNLPILLDNESANKFSKRSAFSLAAILVLYSGRTNVDFQPNDIPISVQFIQTTFDENNITQWVKNILENKEIWTTNFSGVDGLISFVAHSVKNILENGMRESLKDEL